MNSVPELNWWESSGFLHGSHPTLDVDDPRRISSNVFQIYPSGSGPGTWTPLATGVFNIPSSVDGASPSAPQPAQQYANVSNILVDTPLASTNTPLECKDQCAMGGCADPTSAIHGECIASGCCQPHPPSYGYVTAKNISDMAYGDADCIRGPEEFCKSQYTYKQCNPLSTVEAWEDPQCPPQPVPYYVIF